MIWYDTVLYDDTNVCMMYVRMVMIHDAVCAHVPYTQAKALPN